MGQNGSALGYFLFLTESDSLHFTNTINLGESACTGLTQKMVLIFKKLVKESLFTELSCTAQCSSHSL